MMHQNADLIVVARKPLSERTVADNVLRYGTGGINIDESRIGVDERTYKGMSSKQPDGVGTFRDDNWIPKDIEITVNGRFPSNLIIDEEFGKILDAQTGILHSGFMKAGTKRKMSDNPNKNTYGKWDPDESRNDTYGDSGGASRFFKIITDDESESNENINMENVKLLKGNNIDLLRQLEDNSVDSIVTDPPYGLSFMGKKWDYDVPTVELWEECLRVLKPGGHLLAFSGTRTYHRMVVRIEDAGFEIRDMISWLYGSGFPKSMDISKQIDKKLGSQREVIGKTAGSGMTKSNVEQGAQNRNVTEWDVYSNNPVTDEAKEWSGYGTALKPAVEPVVMARKPLSEKTVVDNVLKWGTGGINIDESRIGTDTKRGDRYNDKAPGGTTASFQKNDKKKDMWIVPEGRFPANLIIDEEAGTMLDEQSGISKSSGGCIEKKTGWGEFGGSGNKEIIEGNPGFGEIGGASRFFYCPKVSKSERNEGLDISNPHPTLKPVDLMLYLIRLVTPKGGTTLDPFMGSGSTGKAAVRGGFGFIGMELEEEYFDIAEARIKWESDKPKTITTSKTKKDDVLTNPETIETLNKFFG